MEKGDIITLAIGLVIVLVIAVLANPQYLTTIKGAVEKPTPSPTPIPFPVQTMVSKPPTSTPISIKPTPIPVVTDVPPYQLTFTNNPFKYPVFKLPEKMDKYGATDIVPRKQEWVPFAFVDGKQGGLTQNFSVPYPLWVINTTVTANTNPQYGRFRMALCYTANGIIIEGEEILNQGTSYRLVQVSNTDMYMIISTANIDGYHISLEAPRDYYDLYRSK
ncbi:MAG: hypothetical protein WC626_12680 [Methanoregula sp.]